MAVTGPSNAAVTTTTIPTNVTTSTTTKQVYWYGIQLGKQEAYNENITLAYFVITAFLSFIMICFAISRTIKLCRLDSTHPWVKKYLEPPKTNIVMYSNVSPLIAESIQARLQPNATIRSSTNSLRSDRDAESILTSSTKLTSIYTSHMSLGADMHRHAFAGKHRRRLDEMLDEEEMQRRHSLFNSLVMTKEELEAYDAKPGSSQQSEVDVVIEPLPGGARRSDDMDLPHRGPHGNRMSVVSTGDMSDLIPGLRNEDEIDERRREEVCDVADLVLDMTYIEDSDNVLLINKAHRKSVGPADSAAFVVLDTYDDDDPLECSTDSMPRSTHGGDKDGSPGIFDDEFSCPPLTPEELAFLQSDQGSDYEDRMKSAIDHENKTCPSGRLVGNTKSILAQKTSGGGNGGSNGGGGAYQNMGATYNLTNSKYKKKSDVYYLQ